MVYYRALTRGAILPQPSEKTIPDSLVIGQIFTVDSLSEAALDMNKLIDSSRQPGNQSINKFTNKCNSLPE